MSILEQLDRALGGGCVGPPPASPSGLEATLRPGSGEQLAEALALLHEAGVPVVVRGGGSWDGLGHPMPDARVLLETTGLQAELLVDAEDGVAYLPAGARVSDLGERVRKDSGGAWELALEPLGPHATLGGCLATAAPGLGAGHPRDVVLGLDTVLAAGERVRCGGRVVKNVTGYDLAKLYLGSLGTLAVIEAAWVRLRPAPEVTEDWWLPAPDPAAALPAARLPSVQAAAWLSAELGDSVPGALVSLAGDEAAVRADGDILVRGHAAEPAEPGQRARARVLRAGNPGLRIRQAVLPSALAASAAALAGAGAQVLAQPARGLLWAMAPDERALDVAVQSGHGFLVEAAPEGVRRSRELFGEDEALRPLYRAIKAQYDPRRILNPGRSAGRI